MKSLHPVPAEPDPAAAPRAAQQRFLGGELAPVGGRPRLVKAVLGGALPLKTARDGVIPPRRSGVLPLRHGLSGVGAPASCLLEVAGVERLRSSPAASSLGVDCAACRAWQASQGIVPRRASAPVLARIRAALVDLSPGQAA